MSGLEQAENKIGRGRADMVKLLRRWRVLGLVIASLVAAVSLPAVAAGQDSGKPEGYVVDILSGRLVLIDLGARNNVMKGDYYDIVSSEVLTHPLTGDTLAVTPKSVGALQVEQVYDKMSLARLLELTPGENLMSMPIMRVRHPERLQEIQQLMQRRVYRGRSTSLRQALIPGLYQLKSGQKIKGLSILAVELAALGLGAGYRSSSNDAFDKYRAQTEVNFDFYFDQASDRRTTSNRFFRLAVAAYVYSWVDALWLGGGNPLAAVGAPARHPVRLDLKVGRDGQPLLALTHRF